MPSGSTMLLVSMRMFATFFQSCETGSRSNGFYTLMCGKSFLCGMDTRVCGVSGVLGWMLWRLGGVGRGVLFAFQRAKSYGVFDGDIETTGPVVIGHTARVTGTVVAHDVGVAGTVNGDINAYGRVEIYNGGRVYGDISSSGLRIDDGAIFTGQSTMREDDSDPFMLEPGTNGSI